MKVEVSAVDGGDGYEGRTRATAVARKLGSALSAYWRRGRDSTPLNACYTKTRYHMGCAGGAFSPSCIC